MESALSAKTQCHNVNITQNISPTSLSSRHLSRSYLDDLIACVRHCVHGQPCNRLFELVQGINNAKDTLDRKRAWPASILASSLRPQNSITFMSRCVFHFLCRNRFVRVLGAKAVINAYTWTATIIWISRWVLVQTTGPNHTAWLEEIVDLMPVPKNSNLSCNTNYRLRIVKVVSWIVKRIRQRNKGYRNFKIF